MTDEAENVPSRIGDYKIESELGAGGMAKVYRGRHEILDTHHAIKVLDPSYRANPDARQRFLDEAKIQAKHLNHPNIVKVTTIVATPEHAALVMELVDGPSLESQIGKLQSKPSEIKQIMRGILDAVGYAHKAGIIHRDLKPANVLLARDGDVLVPKVTDFGIAKVTGDVEGASAKKSTRGDARMGTLQYMSPEQVRGAKHVTARSDIFSLGAMLYELATGELPFAAENDFDLMRNIVDGKYVPPGTRKPDMDPQIASVIERALSLDPEARFATCAEMARALLDPASPGSAVGPAIQPTTIKVTEPTATAAHAPPRATPWGKIALIGGAVAVASVIAIVVAMRSPQTQSSQRLVADAGASAAERQACARGELATCTGLCDRGESSACHALATAEKDPAKAIALHEKACNAGDQASCVATGDAYQRGVNIDKNVAKAAGLFQKACDGGHMRGCAMLGEAYVKGRGVPRDVPRGTALVQKACEAKDATGCYHLAMAHWMGIGVKSSHTKAIELLQGACEGDEMRGCAVLGTALINGFYITADPGRGQALQRTACDGGDAGACANIAAEHRYRYGNVPADSEKATELYLKACNLDGITGCGSVGELHVDGRAQGPDAATAAPNAAARAQKACDGGDGIACVDLANLYTAKNGVGPDSVRAEALYNQQCDAGIDDGCSGLVVLAYFTYRDGNEELKVKADVSRAVRLLTRACEKGHGSGCTYLGDMYRDGDAVRKNAATAVTWYQKACDLDDGTGCNELGKIYASGTGVRRDATKAGELYAKACEHGEDSACSK